ncbi:hypothetical protein [Spirosoma pollinicola]|uniref:Uncharacterized protein n=1 Tax=Spirosoma pollinicola TaxID=2057025 RepID=A0A2K8Z4K9_9BACT|nr:hypothetical protein [Spirosoma pollinicola]AUD04805.1 hypothetical protein CWM47_24980 [Spirosoma pollinicola]
MGLTDRWENMNWQMSEFSYAKADLLTELKKQSKSDIAKLLNVYKRQFAGMLVLTVVTPLFALLKPNDLEYVVSIGIVWSYCLILSVFLTIKFIRFKLPDLSLRTSNAIRASLVFVREVNSFQGDFIALYAPILFLGSLLAILTYGGKRLSIIFSDPFSIMVIVVSTLLIIWAAKIMKRFLISGRCITMIAKLEEYLQLLEQP